MFKIFKQNRKVIIGSWAFDEQPINSTIHGDFVNLKLERPEQQFHSCANKLLANIEAQSNDWKALADFLQ